MEAFSKKANSYTTNRIYRFPQKELTIIVLTNRRDAELDALMERLIRMNWP